MNKKIIIFGLLAVCFALGSASAVNAQFTLDSLTEKLASVAVEGRTALDILNEFSQEGELDDSVPKRTIAKQAGEIETIFVFDFSQEPEGAFDIFIDYFVKQEGFVLVNQEEANAIASAELQKGTTRILLAKKGDIVVESRVEGVLLLPEAVSVGSEAAEAGAKAVTPMWILAGVIAVVVVIAAILAVRRFF